MELAAAVLHLLKDQIDGFRPSKPVLTPDSLGDGGCNQDPGLREKGLVIKEGPAGVIGLAGEKSGPNRETEGVGELPCIDSVFVGEGGLTLRQCQSA